MSDLSALKERVEKATGGDQELDRALHAYVCEHVLRWQWKQTGKDYDGQNDSCILVPPDLPQGFTYPPKGAIHPWYPGQWVCAKCKFTLQQMVMSAGDGSVTAQDKPGEPCPNCASPLWRTTWKQEASEMQERAIEQMERERDEARKHAANTRIRERVEVDNLRSRIDQEAARADALQQRVGALEELLKAGLTAVSYAYEQAQAEYHGHDKRAGKFDVFIAGWRKATRTALSQTPTPNAKTEGV